MTIEQRLAEIIRAFCTDSLSSTVNLNVDLDVMLAVLAQALTAALRARLPGYAAATPDTIQRRFLETPGQITTSGDTITVRLERRASHPCSARQTCPPSAPKLENAAAGLARAASLLRHDDPDRAVIESNHGAILEALANLPGSSAPVAVSRAAEAVRLAIKAADATRPEHSEYSNRLLNLIIASATLARLSGDTAVLDDPVTRCRAVKPRTQPTCHRHCSPRALPTP